MFFFEYTNSTFQSSTAIICSHTERDKNHGKSMGRSWAQKWLLQNFHVPGVFLNISPTEISSCCNDYVEDTLGCPLNRSHKAHQGTRCFTTAGKFSNKQQILTHISQKKKKNPPSLGLAPFFCRSNSRQTSGSEF